MPVRIFFCYAHEDEALLIRLKAHLKPLERQGLIETWCDQEISAGIEWEQEIRQRLNEAQIILLLVSPDFMNSEYCYGIELKRALERHKRREALIVPVIGRPVYWQGILGQLQALPKDALPITDPNWHDQDRALHNVTEGLREIANLMLFNQKNLEEKAQRSVFPIQNIASSSADTPLPQSNAAPLPNIPLSPFMASSQSSPAANTARSIKQSSPQLSSPVAPLPTTSQSLFILRRDSESFEKDMIFEEYIVKMVQEKFIPNNWRIYKPTSKKIIRNALNWGFAVGIGVLGFGGLEGIVIGIASMLGQKFTYSPLVTSVLIGLVSVTLSVLLGGLTYMIYRHYWQKKEIMLVLTPNGYIWFEGESPRHMIRYSVVSRITYENRSLSAYTNMVGWINIRLTHFETPETIAQHIDHAYKGFQKDHSSSTT